MKTSNKLLATLAFIILVGMTSFTILLKKEYRKAAAKSEKDKEEIVLQAFDKLEILTNNGISVSIEEGTAYTIKNMPKAKVIGSTLHIDGLPNSYRGDIVITTPKLPAIKLNGYEIALNINGKTNKFANNSLNINSTATGNLNINNCDFTNVTIKTENIAISDSWQESYYHFHFINSKVSNSDITLKGKSTLSLKNTALLSPTFSLSDSASISIEGSAMNPFVKK